MTLIEHPTAPLVILIAGAEDRPELQQLAELDSTVPFTGAALVVLVLLTNVLAAKLARFGGATGKRLKGATR